MQTISINLQPLLTDFIANAAHVRILLLVSPT